MAEPPLFLWPETVALSTRDVLGVPCATAEIEEHIRTLYPAGEPVLFSSARAGLTAILETLNFSRPNLVWVPTFSSHCVLESIAHVCTPSPVDTGSPAMDAALVYHQWGHIHQGRFAPSTVVIEDAVDSLMLPGTSPFAIQGDFALWSLPKVVASLAGGVVFCRHVAAATQLKKIRDSRGSSAFQATLRLRSKSNSWAARYWNGAEAMQGELPAVFRRQVQRKVSELHRIAEERLTLLRHLSQDMAKAYEATGRLPSNIPLCLPPNWQRVWGPGGQVSSGLRSFNLERTCPGNQWVKVAPLPVHAGASTARIRTIFAQLELPLKDRIHEFEII